MTVNGRIHAPACEDFDTHVFNAVQELGTDAPDLLTFVDQVVADWAEELELADRGDAAVVAHYVTLEAERIFAIDHWTLQ